MVERLPHRDVGRDVAALPQLFEPATGRTKVREERCEPGGVRKLRSRGAQDGDHRVLPELPALVANEPAGYPVEVAPDDVRATAGLARGLSDERLPQRTPSHEVPRRIDDADGELLESRQ